MERLFDLLLSLLGALLVVALLVLGVNLRQLRDRSPGWLRRVVIGGLALLGISGFGPEPARATEWVQNPHVQKETGGPALDQTESGKSLMKIWEEAEEVAGGKRGEYPFDEKGKKRLLGDLERAKGLIDDLVKTNVYQAAEGDLLKIDLQQLVIGVQEKRPTEMQMATCYEPMMPTPLKESFERLAARLPFLEKLAMDKLSPEAAGKVLEKVSQDLGTLAGRSKGQTYEKIDEAKAKDLEDRVARQIEQIRANLEKRRNSPGSQ